MPRTISTESVDVGAPSFELVCSEACAPVAGNIASSAPNAKKGVQRERRGRRIRREAAGNSEISAGFTADSYAVVTPRAVTPAIPAENDIL